MTVLIATMAVKKAMPKVVSVSMVDDFRGMLRWWQEIEMRWGSTGKRGADDVGCGTFAIGLCCNRSFSEQIVRSKLC